MCSPRPLHCSVPYGSCLGPWLCLKHAGTLIDVVPNSIAVYSFVDDHIANKPFRPTLVENEEHAINELENCAVTINNWMRQNKLKINTSKTEFILFGNRQ